MIACFVQMPLFSLQFFRYLATGFNTLWALIATISFTKIVLVPKKSTESNTGTIFRFLRIFVDFLQASNKSGNSNSNFNVHHKNGAKSDSIAVISISIGTVIVFALDVNERW